MKFLPFFLDRGPFLSLCLSLYFNLAKVKLLIKRGIHFKWAGQSAAAYQLNDLIRIQHCDFPFSSIFFFFLEGRKMDNYDNVAPRTRYRKSRNRKVYFSIAFPPTLVSFHATPSFLWTFTNPLPDTYCIGKNVEWRWSAAVVTPFRECDDTANSERIFRYTPGCIKFCNVINACLTSRILAIRRIDKCLKFLFFSLYISFYIKSGHRMFWFVVIIRFYFWNLFDRDKYWR